MLQKEFDMVVKRYTDYTAGVTHTHEEKVNYINQQYNSLNIISKMIALSSSGVPIEQQVSIATKEPVITKTNKEESNVIESEDETITSKDVLTEDLKAWGIKERTCTWEVVMALLEVKNIGFLNYNGIVDEVCRITKRKKSTVSSAYALLCKHAKFENSKYNAVLAVLPREQITKEVLISELVDFIKE